MIQQSCQPAGRAREAAPGSAPVRFVRVLVVLLCLLLPLVAAAPAGATDAARRLSDAGRGADAALRTATPAPNTLYVAFTGGTARRYLVFLPGGLLGQGLPVAGIDGLSAAGYGGLSSLGRTALQGTTVTVRWTTGQVSTGRLASGGAKLTMFGYTYLRVASPRDGGLAGTFARAGGEASWPTITFNAAGRFVDGGIARLTAALTTTSKVGGGRYRIRNHTLHLFYDDGAVQRFAIYTGPEAVSSPPARANIGGYVFLRR